MLEVLKHLSPNRLKYEDWCHVGWVLKLEDTRLNYLTNFPNEQTATIEKRHTNYSTMNVRRRSKYTLANYLLDVETR